MDIKEATTVLSALAQPTRLEAFRLLVTHEPEVGERAQSVLRLRDGRIDTVQEGRQAGA